MARYNSENPSEREAFRQKIGLSEDDMVPMQPTRRDRKKEKEEDPEPEEA